MMTATEVFRSSHRRLPKPLFRLIEGQVGLALLLWAGFVLVVLIGTAVVPTEITQSVWESASSQIIRWYGLFIGVYVGYTILPLHITHGQTRREFGQHILVFVIVFAAAIAIMIAIGFLLEAGLYEIAGWPKDIEDRHLYDSPWELHLIIVESWFVQALWTAAGVFMGAAFYRSDFAGWLAVTASILVAGVAGIVFGNGWGPFGWAYEEISGEVDVRAVVGIPLYIVCIALVTAMTWQVIRDIPIRNRTP